MNHDGHSQRFATLTEDQSRHFIEKGYVIVEGCLDRKLAESWTEDALRRLGATRKDPATWPKDIVWMDHFRAKPVKEISPRAWGAICDVASGEQRIETRVIGLPSVGHFTTINSFEWSDAFIVNFNRGADAPWQPPSAQAKGWHKDGSYFRHFLDSKEQSLLTILLWSDVAPHGGGTFIAPDSIGVVARFLRDHPEGVEPDAFGSLIGQCKEFVEVTGPIGTFVILHPFMLHASSGNHSGIPRFMTNPPIVLKDTMNLNRENPAELSLLERATLRALDAQRYDFKPTTPRRADWWFVEERARSAGTRT